MKSPFKFLDAYTKEDRDIFFGRDREIEELYQKVFESKILLLFGVSGTGKSSLIDCGLGNKLNDSDWLPISIRRGRNMVESLLEAVKSTDEKAKSGEKTGSSGNEARMEQGKNMPGNLSAKKAVKSIRSLYLDNFKPIYLIFDQFEELFIFGDPDEKKQFIELIEAILGADLQCKMLFAIREEYLANMTEFEKVLPQIMENRMRVEKMNHSNAIQVIEGPCRVNGIELEEGFAETLLDKLVPEGKEVELTYLQVYLDKVFRGAVGKISGRKPNSDSEKAKDQAGNIAFTIEQLEELGDVGDLLGSFLEDQIALLESPESGLAVLKSFVSIKGTKKQITLEETLESCKTYGQSIAEADLKKLINLFVDLRILRDKDANGRYELRHDSLAAKIFEKITLVEKELMEVRAFIESAYTSYQARKTLLSEKDLVYIAPYEDRLFLTGQLKKFLEESKHELDAAKRSFRKIISISIIGFILIIAAGAYYYNKKMSDRNQEWSTLSSLLQSEYSPELGLKAILPVIRKDSMQTVPWKLLINNFAALLEKNPDIKEKLFSFEEMDADITEIYLSKDGSLLYGYLTNNRICVWDLMGEMKNSFQSAGKIELLKLSADNHYIGAYEDSVISVFFLEDTTHLVLPCTPNGINEKYIFDFSEREEYLVAVVYMDKVRLYRKDGSLFQELENDNGKINTLDVAPDKRFLASGSSEGIMNLWYFNSLSGEYNVYNEYTNKMSSSITSCQFNDSSNYILYTSFDSISRLLKFDNTNIIFIHNPTFPGYNYWELVQKLENSTFGLEIDARFAPGEKTIIVSLYEKDWPEEEARTKTNKYLIHSLGNPFSANIRSNSFHPDFLDELYESDPVSYDYLVPAPDGLSVSTVVKGSDKIQIVAWDHIPLTYFPGSCPLYSSDSKYLFSINGKCIEKRIIGSSELMNLIWNKKLFGELESDGRDWVTY